MLFSLVEEYAILARQFAEEAARLGQHADRQQDHISPEFLKQWNEITKRRELCDSAAGKLGRYIKAQRGPNIRHRSVGVGH
jgi:hypothetical protein